MKKTILMMAVTILTVMACKKAEDSKVVVDKTDSTKSASRLSKSRHTSFWM